MAHADSDFIALQSALAGEYSLDREIGRGGMGIVYLAREVRLARPVAIKVLPPGIAARAELRSAFLGEAQTVARLNHPNIVPVYAAGERNGFAYIVMAYVDGFTLGERLRMRGPLLPGQAARVLREVAWALAYAHGAGIVHRDVSAENIMLERGTERAIVTDFGIASAMDSAALNADGRVMGNAYYVSPEQAAGEPLDERSDLYSLGVAGFYALTGRLPFEGETSSEIVTQHLTRVAPAITSVAPTVPPRLAAAVERCLHKEPIRRYRNAESFAEAIDLAFEHAKDVPVPLRSWITQGEKELPARFAMVGMGAIAGTMIAFVSGQAWWSVVPLGIMSTVSMGPWMTRLRQILGEGYTTDDLSAALREHQLARAEEMEYERRLGSPLVKRVLRIVFGASTAATALAAYEMSQVWTLQSAVKVVQPGAFQFARAYGAVIQSAEIQALAVLFAGLAGLTIAGVPLAGEFIRFRLSSRIAGASISFWKSKWGRRIAKLASLGQKKVDRPMLGMPVLTEIALGRATDHLYEALPKEARRQLATLPATVRRLEEDAHKLRDSISALDDQLAAFERGGGGMNELERTELSDELRVQRDLAGERLASTVGAIENIRLDLLRLQMGNASIQSVTESLESALSIGKQIELTMLAQSEIEALLRPPPMDREALQDSEDDDSDTPVSGVPAARG